MLLLGVSYKKGVGDMREAPALKIAHLLRELGADVAYHDPHVPEIPELELASEPLDEELGALRRRLRDHRARRGRLRASGRAGRRWWSTSAASPASIAAENLIRL